MACSRTVHEAVPLARAGVQAAASGFVALGRCRQISLALPDVRRLFNFLEVSIDRFNASSER